MFARLEGGFGFLACIALFGFFSTHSRYQRPKLSLMFLVALIIGGIGCGGSAAGGTPKGSYSVTITGSGGSQTHTASVSVSVQ